MQRIFLTNLVCEDFGNFNIKKNRFFYKAHLFNFQNWVFIVTDITERSVNCEGSLTLLSFVFMERELCAGFVMKYCMPFILKQAVLRVVSFYSLLC